MKCPQCGRENNADALYCSFCGAKIQQTIQMSIRENESALIVRQIYTSLHADRRPVIRRKSTEMMCPECGSDNVTAQAVTDVYSENRGCLSWCLWLILSALTGGLAFIIALITNSKTRSETHTEVVCQSCGNRWRMD